MKRLLGCVLAVMAVVTACEPLDDDGGGGGGGATTFTKGFVFVREDKNIYAADSTDYQSVMRVTTNGNNKHPSLSKDGKTVVFVHADGANTVIQKATVASDQTPAVVFTSDTNNRNFKNPVLSPDGTKIAFNLEKGTTTSIGLVNADGSNFQLLTAGTLSFGAPAFFPDGDELIAAAGTQATTLTSVQRITLTGTTASVRSTLGNEAIAVVNRVVLSPDGTMAAFDGQVSSGSVRIFVMPIAGGLGGNVTQLTDHPSEPNARDSFPTFISATELAWGSDTGNADQVYVGNPNSTTKLAGTLIVPSALEPWFGPN